MKNLLLFLFSVTINAAIYAQAPQALNYQAIARNLDGSIISGQSIRVRFSILDGSATGTVVYQEVHQTTPNNFGVFTLAIGSGNVISGSFSGINWSTGSKFLKVEIAPQGGINFSLQGTTQLLSVPYALYAEKSGTASQQGLAGANGRTILNGIINPTAATGVDGDFYINTATNQIFGPKAGGIWSTGISLTGPIGPAGPQGSAGVAGPVGATGPMGPAGPQGNTGVAGATGPQGAAGANGKTILNGTIDPATTAGIDGDFYINTATNQIFGPKAGGIWGTGINLTGPAGPTGLQGSAGVAGPVGATGATGQQGSIGPQGSTGIAGAAGANGKTILNGTIDPTTTTGVDGDFYINAATNQIFGPKTSGSWGTGISLTGPMGPAGPQGNTGATGQQGPTGATGLTGPQGTAGAVGQQGPAGANGKTILNGTIDPTAAAGVDGDFYINTATNQIFGPKISGSWGTGISLTGPVGPVGPQGNTGVTGATGPQGPAGATGPVGLMGPVGPQGNTGMAGATGQQGPSGINGKTILNGTLDPAIVTGVDGDFYINTATNQLFGPKTSGSWSTGISLTGPIGPAGPQGNAGVAGVAGATGQQGPAGSTGPAGANGKTILNGTADPATTAGIDGDFYINTATNQIFGPKAGGLWGTGISLIGPVGPAGVTGQQGPAGSAGPAGATGATGSIGPIGPTGQQGNIGVAGVTGPQGAAGANGKTILNGTIDPTAAAGVDGDFYINTATNQIFGPKASGIWGTGINLTGPIGPAGPVGPQGSAGVTGATGQQGPIGPQGSSGIAGVAGANGKTILNGTIDPTAAAGVDGDFYINTATNQIFGPKASGIWGTGISLTGPMGPAGPQGNAGVAGPVGATGAIGPQGSTGIAGAIGATGLQGPAGATGPQGAAGANGKTILSGTIDPATTTGVDGDFYINTSTNQIFGPKTSGAWGTAVSLTGPAGVKSLIDLQNFSGNATCPSGGITIKSGVDNNNNNILDPSEIDNTKDICFAQKAAMDKLIILPLFNSAANGAGVGSTVIAGTLLKFNKNNYPLVDSIIFIADPYVGTSGNTVTLTLYNRTNNVSIANSTLTTTTVQGSAVIPFLQTGNLYNDLPNYDITLGISIQSATGGFVNSSATGGCYLYLYRK